MKVSCDVIRDLMILCEDEDGSEESKRLVEAHKKDCRECEEYYNKLFHTEELVLEVKQEFAEKRILHKGFAKIKRRWFVYVTCVLMIFPVIVLGILGYNEKRKSGVCFSNIDDIYRCVKFVKHIENGEFEKATASMDFSGLQYDFAENVKELSQEEFVSYMRDKVEHKMEEYQKLGISIRDVSFEYAYKTEEGWQVELAFFEVYPDKSSQRVFVSIDADTMLGGAYNGTGEKDIYIDEILNIFIQDDPLNYREKNMTFSLKEGECAVVSWELNENVREEVGSIHVFQISYGTGFGVNVREEYQMQRKQRLEASVPGEYAVEVWDTNGQKMNAEGIVKIKIEKY